MLPFSDIFLTVKMHLLVKVHEDKWSDPDQVCKYSVIILSYKYKIGTVEIIQELSHSQKSSYTKENYISTMLNSIKIQLKSRYSYTNFHLKN